MDAQAQHLLRLNAVQRAAARFEWPAWIEPYFFAGASYQVVARDPGTVIEFVADLRAAIDVVRRTIAAAAPAPADGPLPARKAAILDALRAAGGGLSMVELAQAVDVPKVGLKKCVQQLTEAGLVTAIGKTRARRYHAAEPSKSRGPAEQAPPATATAAPGDLQPLAPPPATPAPADGAPSLDPISPRVRRELAREDADRAKRSAAGTPPVSALLRRRIALYFAAHGRTDTLAGIAAKLNLTGDAIRPTVQSMLESGALEPVPGATPTRYRQPEAQAA